MTVPKCGNNQLLEANLRLSFGEKLKAYIISLERHADGTPHLHAAVELTQKMSIRQARLNRLTGRVCNIRACTMKFGWINAVKYVAGLVEKKSNDHHVLISHPPDLVEEVLRQEKLLTDKRSSRSTSGEAFRLALGGSSTFQILSALPALALQTSSVERLVNLVELENQRTSKPPEVLTKITSIGPFYRDLNIICKWVTDNLISPVKPRPLRSPQLYIHGPPRSCKTLFLFVLSRFYKPYLMTGEKCYIDDWHDELYDFVIFDEFDGDRPITFMNHFLDGSPMRYQRKCLPSSIKRHNVPVIICSNINPDHLYPNSTEVVRKAFRDRLSICDVSLVDLSHVKLNDKFLHSYVNQEE